MTFANKAVSIPPSYRSTPGLNSGPNTGIYVWSLCPTDTMKVNEICYATVVFAI